MLLDSAAAHGLKVAFAIEGMESGRVTVSQVKSEIEYIYKKYGSRQAFFRVSRPTKYGPSSNPRGVFYIFNAMGIHDGKRNATPEEWRRMLDSIRGTPFDAFVLSQPADVSWIDAAHFDGLFTYDVFPDPDPNQPQTLPNQFRSLNAEVARRGGMFVPSVGPGYVDQRAKGTNRFKDRANGRRYDEYWERAIDSGAEWITITSFNEWHEGTQIEPAVPKSIPGFTYLNYEGAYGLRGAQAELAYIERTRQMIDLFTKRRTRLGVTTHSPRRNQWVRRR
jgi:hypothetical protein